MTAIPVELAGRHYPTKSALNQEIRRILNDPAWLNNKIVGENAILVAALFDRHPDKEDKLGGLSISHFEVRQTPYPTIAFHVIRSDGSAVDFKTGKCV
jgi:hypothetical protein